MGEKKVTFTGRVCREVCSHRVEHLGKDAHVKAGGVIRHVLAPGHDADEGCYEYCDDGDDNDRYFKGELLKK